MRLEHEGNRPRQQARLAVASVSHTTQKTMYHALLTRRSVSVQSRGRTQKSVVMQRLDDRDIFLLTYFVHGRRHHGKSIVNMNNIRLLISEKTAYIKFGITG